MNKSGILILFIYLLISGCDREAINIDLPDFRQKLVVHSYLSPGDTFHIVKVTSNIPVYGEINDHLSTGTLSGTISDETNTIELTPFQSGLYFTDDEMKVEAGHKYTLKIESSTGLQAEATCTVPEKADLKIEADSDHVYVNDWYRGKLKQIIGKIYLTDPAGTSNYYRLKCCVRYYDHTYYRYPLEYILVGKEEELFNDTGKDGQKMLVSNITISDPSKTDSSFLIIYTLQTDLSYYNYHYSLSRYSSGDSPFTEVSPLFTNISGGLGVFASYISDSLVVRLK